MKKGLVVRGKSAPRPFEKLPKKQQEFVRRYVQTADVELAYIEAGFIGSDRSRMGNARKLLNALRPYIAAATKEYVTGVDMTILGMAVVRGLATGAESEMVRLNAAKELLVRNMDVLPQEAPKEAGHLTALTDEQLKERIRAIQEQVFIAAKPVNVVPLHAAK